MCATMRWMAVAVLAWWPPAWAGTASPSVALVDVYRGGVELPRYWVSEKFDGVRGYWDGHRLLTREGVVIRMPGWFTRHWPATPMDGELWAGYGRFERASAIVRASAAADLAWREIMQLSRLEHGTHNVATRLQDTNQQATHTRPARKADLFVPKVPDTTRVGVTGRAFGQAGGHGAQSTPVPSSCPVGA